MALWGHAKQEGQSLVEILVAISVVVVVLVALVSAVVGAVKGARFSQQKVRANSLAQEGVEWLRSQRAILGWADFYVLSSSGGAKYCLDNLELTQIGSCSSSRVIENKFTREVVLTAIGDAVKVTLTTGWEEGKQDFESKLETTLTKWDTN